MPTKYLRVGASGTGSGDDWTNAYASVSAAMTGITRGDTLYVAGSATNYGEAAWNKANSGTTVITVKKATAADHGTETGWDSSYGTLSADFTRWIFSSDYWVMDGQVGGGTEELYGVSAITPYTQYGFRVKRSTLDDGAGSVMSVGSSGAPRTDLTIKYTESCYTNDPESGAAWGTKGQASSNAGSACTNLTVSHCWFHDAGSVTVFCRKPGLLLEYSICERNGQAQNAANYSPAEHSEMIDLTEDEGGVNPIIRYNIFRDWRSTGCIIVLDHDIAENIRIYGNVFTHTGYFPAVGGNGVISANAAATVISAFVYQNTFVGLNYDSKIYADGTITAASVKNNLFDDVGSFIFGGNVTHDYNWFREAGTQSEPNIQNGAADPFVDRAVNDWHLAANTDAGEDLGVDYDEDMDGVARATWSRGAFEFKGAEAGPVNDARIVIARAA